jgi:hypothetical protein
LFLDIESRPQIFPGIPRIELSDLLRKLLPTLFEVQFFFQSFPLKSGEISELR